MIRAATSKKTPFWLMLLIIFASVAVFVFILGLTAFVTRDQVDVRVLQEDREDAGPGTVLPKVTNVARTTIADEVVLSLLEPRRETLQQCFRTARVTDLSAPLAAKLRLKVRTGEYGARIHEMRSMSRLPMGLSSCLKKSLVVEREDQEQDEEEGARLLLIESIDGILRVELQGI